MKKFLLLFLMLYALTSCWEKQQKGKIIFHGADGYRAFFTLSEIMNRTDDGKLIWMEKRKTGGQYRSLPTFDFFSDRAVKALYKIEMTDIEKIYLSSPQ